MNISSFSSFKCPSLAIITLWSIRNESMSFFVKWSTVLMVYILNSPPYCVQAIGLPFPNSTLPVSLNCLIRVSKFFSLMNKDWNSRNCITDVYSIYFTARFTPEIRQVFILNF